MNKIKLIPKRHEKEEIVYPDDIIFEEYVFVAFNKHKEVTHKLILSLYADKYTWIYVDSAPDGIRYTTPPENGFNNAVEFIYQCGYTVFGYKL